MNKSNSLKWVLLCVGVFALNLSFFSSAAQAASVGAVKGQKVLINLDGDSTAEGEEYYLIDPSTRKKTAIIRVTKIKGGKALADLLKGRATVGFSLQAKAPSQIPLSTDVSSESGEPVPFAAKDLGQLKTLRDSYGITGSYIMNSMNADITYRDNLGVSSKASVSMSGTGFGVGGFYDYAFASSFVGRAFVAIEQFNVAGSAASAACAGSTSCDAKINYLSSYGLVKWYPMKDTYRAWVGGGLGFLLAVSKSSTALNQSQISTNQVYTAAVGFDLSMDRRTYIPLSLEYNSFPASSTVNASMMVLKAGWAWNL